MNPTSPLRCFGDPAVFFGGAVGVFFGLAALTSYWLLSVVLLPISLAFLWRASAHWCAAVTPVVLAVVLWAIWLANALS